MESTEGSNTPQSGPERTPRCPRCGCEVSLEKYRQLAELGIDFVRDACMGCGTILLISFQDGTATESP